MRNFLACNNAPCLWHGRLFSGVCVTNSRHLQAKAITSASTIGVAKRKSYLLLQQILFYETSHGVHPRIDVAGSSPKLCSTRF
jgi:hypothetical protein